MTNEQTPEQGDTATKGKRTIVLPSGRKASVRKAYGRDLVQAVRMAGGSNDGIKLTFGIIATVADIDGHPMVIEDVEGLELADVMKLMAEVMGNDASLPTSISSSFGSTAGFSTPN